MYWEYKLFYLTLLKNKIGCYSTIRKSSNGSIKWRSKKYRCESGGLEIRRMINAFIKYNNIKVLK